MMFFARSLVSRLKLYSWKCNQWIKHSLLRSRLFVRLPARPTCPTGSLLPIDHSQIFWPNPWWGASPFTSRDLLIKLRPPLPIDHGEIFWPNRCWCVFPFTSRDLYNCVVAERKRKRKREAQIGGKSVVLQQGAVFRCLPTKQEVFELRSMRVSNLVDKKMNGLFSTWGLSNINYLIRKLLHSKKKRFLEYPLQVLQF